MIALSEKVELRYLIRQLTDRHIYEKVDVVVVDHIEGGIGICCWKNDLNELRYHIGLLVKDRIYDSAI